MSTESTESTVIASCIADLLTAATTGDTELFQDIAMQLEHREMVLGTVVVGSEITVSTSDEDEQAAFFVTVRDA